MPGQRVILVADRNSNVRNLLRREFEREGYEVRTARNGEELILSAQRPGPLDAVIMDLDLPLLDGARALRGFQEREHPIPVIIHTAEDRPAGLANFPCVAAFIEKGGDLEELKKAVELAVLAGRSGNGRPVPGPLPRAGQGGI